MTLAACYIAPFSNYDKVPQVETVPKDFPKAELPASDNLMEMATEEWKRFHPEVKVLRVVTPGKMVTYGASNRVQDVAMVGKLDTRCMIFFDRLVARFHHWAGNGEMVWTSWEYRVMPIDDSAQRIDCSRVEASGSAPGGPTPGNPARSPAEIKQSFQATQEQLEREHRKLVAEINDVESDYQGWMKKATQQQLESPEYKAAAERHDQATADLGGIETQHQDLLQKIDGMKESPSAEQLKEMSSSYHSLSGKLREDKSSLDKAVHRLKEITHRYK
jgi:hypothetical protein